ncbi:hypothetical protein QL285_082569 [Trifolium repens]|nr:hypothetical protein QL285_082569 [Trifolium repens]
MMRFQKAFVGVVANPGTTYNIQNAFHMQGYFGVKITPLGSNLSLLEGQEEGEVEALMEDAKDWLDQWFKEIHPWSPKDIDLERIVWLRIFGVPAHAWNDAFFIQVARPWGTFLNVDDVTNKKITMDVARILVRTSCQKAVDEFIDVIINGELFHLRVIEDSFGPMRILSSKSQNQDGRLHDSDNSDAEGDDEEERNLAVAEEVSERESEGEGENLIALNYEINANHLHNNDKEGEVPSVREERLENSNLNKESLKTVVGGVELEGGAFKKDNLGEGDGKCVGQEDGSIGPATSTNSHHIVTGGAVRRLSKSVDLGRSCKPIVSQHCDSGGKGGLKGGVYSDGPRHVYNILNSGPRATKTPKKHHGLSKSKGPTLLNNVLPSASLRKQQHWLRSLNSRNSNSVSISSVSCPRREGSGEVGV